LPYLCARALPRNLLDNRLALGQSLSFPIILPHHPGVLPHHPGAMHPFIQEQTRNRGVSVRRGVGSNSATDNRTCHIIYGILLGSWFVASPSARGKDTGLSSKDSSKRMGATVGLGAGIGVGATGAYDCRLERTKQLILVLTTRFDPNGCASRTSYGA
jgi:hypothetical protein